MWSVLSYDKTSRTFGQCSKSLPTLQSVGGLKNFFAKKKPSSRNATKITKRNSPSQSTDLSISRDPLPCRVSTLRLFDLSLRRRDIRACNAARDEIPRLNERAERRFATNRKSLDVLRWVSGASVGTVLLECLYLYRREGAPSVVELNVRRPIILIGTIEAIRCGQQMRRHSVQIC